MSVISCDHNTFIVCFDVKEHQKCPACELEETVEDLEDVVKEYEAADKIEPYRPNGTDDTSSADS